MTIDPLNPYLSLAAVTDATQAETLKPSSVMEAHLDRIARLAPKIGAFCF